jgi:hypothetical protein
LHAFNPTQEVPSQVRRANGVKNVTKLTDTGISTIFVFVSIVSIVYSVGRGVKTFFVEWVHVVTSKQHITAVPNNGLFFLMFEL